MNRSFSRLAVSLALAVAFEAVPAAAQTPSELAQTARYVAAFQNRDGGFAGAPGGHSTLGATSSAVRVLKYTGGSIPDVLGAIAYVKSCRDAASGGFAPTPGGKPDVGTTASGLMAFGELKIPDDAAVDAAVAFLATHAKTFEEVRIAVAGMEAVRRTSPEFPKWEALVKEGRNADGTFGQGPAAARDTGGKAVALLRMGVTLDQKEAIVAALKAAQRDDGAWGRDDSGPDLESTYRIMRFFFMAKETPDLDRLRGFLARCRHSDGAYGTKPGDDANTGGTYFASIILYWSRILEGGPAVVETAGFEPLFNGKDLNGWEGDPALWSARHGWLVGHHDGLKHNDFLATDGRYKSFVLKATFQLVKNAGNSGIQFRSERVPNHEMKGYQADIGWTFWGCLYDESRRNRVLAPASEPALGAAHKEGWNEYVIDAKGADIRLALNGVTSVNYHEAESGIAPDGRIAVQLHSGDPTEVRFRDIYIQALPDPVAGTVSGPGFHLRTLKAADGERKYAVYLPKGHDGKTKFPVVLFLHGSGERGDDGVKPAQVGLGPAVFNHPDSFPAIAVFPQARKTWAAGSDDAKSALAALDEVIKDSQGDPKRVVLTGLSMGGFGSWELAAENPDRFVAVVPVCGADPRVAKVGLNAFAHLPVRTYVGDADGTSTVQGLRSMIEAIRQAGGDARLTEYRGVGHNSWDRAYNDPALVDWMLTRKGR